MRECWNGRQARLRCVWFRRVGSSPISRTKKEGAVNKVPEKKQAVPKGTACKIFIEKRLDQWKNQPFSVII